MTPNFIPYLLLLYFIPLLTVIFLSKGIVNSWTALSVGFFLTFSGALTFFALWRRWESTVRAELGEEIAKERNLRQKELIQHKEVTEVITVQEKEQVSKLQNMLSESEKKLEIQSIELLKRQDDIKRIEGEREKWLLKIESLQRDLKHSHELTQNELSSQAKQVGEWEKKIADLESSLKKKQETIEELESKISDLNYEIKTLLHLTEFNLEETVSLPEKSQPFTPPPPPAAATEQQKQVTSPEEASILLKRCVDIAQKLSGTSHFMNPSSRFRDLHMDSYALDLRRLYDSLRSETLGTILIFSQKENKVLFINEQTQNLVGLTSDQLLQDFPKIVEENSTEWQKGVLSLASQPETKISLQIKAKSGQKISLFCQLRAIPTGVFRSHILGVLYKVKT